MLVPWSDNGMDCQEPVQPLRLDSRTWYSDIIPFLTLCPTVKPYSFSAAKVCARHNTVVEGFGGVPLSVPPSSWMWCHPTTRQTPKSGICPSEHCRHREVDAKTGKSSTPGETNWATPPPLHLYERLKPRKIISDIFFRGWVQDFVAS